MNLKNPVIIDNQTYDKAVVNLAISTNLDSNGNTDLNMAIRIVPARIDSERGVVTADANALGIFRGCLSEMVSEGELNLSNGTLSLLQNLINEKT